MRRRTALFGGTFDPFHLGHFLIARTAREIFSLDQVVFLPCSQSPLKAVRPIASDRARLGWLRAGLKGERWASVSSWEIDRHGPSYSVEAARHWKALEPKGELYWILGSDQWSTLPRWKSFEELGGLVKFLVFPRPEVAQVVSGDNEPHLKAIAGEIDRGVEEAGGRKPYRISGNSASQWIILDYGDVLVHVMHSARRNFYRLENLWGDADRIDK
ncbi:MAG: nicotinate (nicotinamide) nucleotide adenylyltransferase [Verrucomicrobia bacterium]|nr:nicotinate (nicotinamide) nucleotide adenylyltransferase [Verrucomicrobiota bacterium]